MNLVMDDFYHAHAHSQRLLSTEDCGSFVTSSQAGDYTLTRTGNTEQPRTGDVAEYIQGKHIEGYFGFLYSKTKSLSTNCKGA